MKKVIAAFLAVFVLASSCSFVTFADGEYNFTYTTNGTNATITGVENLPDGLEELVIPEKIGDCNVVAIGDNAFKGNTFTGTVIIPGCVETIGNSAFLGCKATAFILGEGVKKIGEKSFSALSSEVKYINLPSTITSVGSAAFKSSSNILYLEMSEGFTSIGAEVFYSVGDLARGWTDTVIPSSVNAINTGAFSGSRHLSTVYLLGENVNFTGPKFDSGDYMNPLIKGIGSQINGGATNANDRGATFYVVNENIRQALLDYNYPEKNGAEKPLIRVLEHKIGAFYDSFNKANIISDDDDDGEITAPYPTGRAGYRFLYWNIDGNRYYPGDTIPLSKSIAVTGAWVSDKEASDVVYKNITADEFEPSAVDKIICKSLAKQEVEIEFIDENGVSSRKTVFFDMNGIWKNAGDTTLYKKVIMDNMPDDLAVLTAAEGELSFDILLRKSRLLVAPKIGGTENLNDLEWSSSDESVAAVSNGVVTGVSSGSAVISAKNGEKSYSFTVRVFGEIDLAEINNTVNEYLAEKSSLFAAIDSKIGENDYEGLAKILGSSDPENKLSLMADADNDAIANLTDTQLSDFAKRVIIYGKFNINSADKVRQFVQTLKNELVVGEVNDIVSTAEVEEILNRNNIYYNLKLDNEYYLQYKDEVLKNFVGYKAPSLKGLQADFTDKYIMTAVCSVPNESGYSVLQEIIGNSADEIGYDVSHYKEVNSTSMHTSLLSKIADGSITSITELKKFIDEYKKPDTNNNQGSQGNRPSSGGGGGGSSSGKTFGGVTSQFIGEEEKEYSDNPLPSDQSPVFSDLLKDRWSYEAVKFLVAKQVVSGYSDGSFAPENNVTRAEFIKMISKAFKLEPDAPAEEASAEKTDDANGEETAAVFNDVGKDDWYYNSVISAYDKGIVTGDANGSFNPNTEITRQEMAAIIYRAMVAAEINADTVRSVNLTDKESIDDWAYMPVTQLVNMGIVNGYEDGAFKPFNSATREEAAKLIYEVMNIAKN